MSTELSTLLHNQLGDILKRHLAARGENHLAAEKAVNLALPSVIAGVLAHVNGSRDKAMALYNKIMDDKSELQQALSTITASGSIPTSLTELGQHFSASIFGTDQASVVAAHIGKESGVSDESATNLLSSALPLVLAVLRGQSWSPAALYQVLSNQSNWLSKALPAGIMIALGIGSTAGLSASVAALASTLSGYVAPPVATGVASGAAVGATATHAAITNVASSGAASSGGSGWVKALVWIGLGILAIFGLRMCMNDQATKKTQPTTTVSQSASSDSAASETSALVPATPDAASNETQSSDNADKAQSDATKSTSDNADKAQSDAAKSTSDNADKAQSDAAKSTSDNADKAQSDAEKSTSDNADKAQSDAEKSTSDNADKAKSDTTKSTSDNADKAQSDENKSSDNADKAKSDTENTTSDKAESSKTTPPANESRAVAEDGMVKFYFATGFSRLAKNADDVAKDAIEAGKSGKKLIISGFTDSTGKAAANEKLSRKRAEVVKQFFIERGVDEKNIELRKPKNSVGAKGESQEGRRVEVQIKD